MTAIPKPRLGSMATMEPQILIIEDHDGGDWALCRVAYFDELTNQRDELLSNQKQQARVLVRMKQAVSDWKDGSDFGAQVISSLVDDWIEQLEALTNRTSKHGHDPAFDDLIASGGLPEAQSSVDDPRRVEDEMFRIAAQNATDANTRLASTAAQRDALLAALKALVEDYELLLGDGLTDSTAPSLLNAARAAIAKAEGT